jgi:hypothetical protein
MYISSISNSKKFINISSLFNFPLLCYLVKKNGKAAGEEYVELAKKE